MLWYAYEQTIGDIVRSHEELDAAIDRVAALAGPDWPALAEVTQLENKFGPVLYLGMHLDQGALAYAGNHQRVYTLGEGTQDGEPILYMYTTSDNEFPPNSEVPAALIRQAAHEFADTGQRPTCVEWQVWEREFADSGSDWPDL
jgi:hypothetical protein